MTNLPFPLQLASHSAMVDKLKSATPSNNFRVEEMLLGLPHRYGRGGVHAALNNCHFKATEETKIMAVDFASFYPVIMLHLPWVYSKMSRDKFKSLLYQRLKAKYSGDKAASKMLKQVIDPVYGQARKANEAYGLDICIAGQLLITDLLTQLEQFPEVVLINTNTDGVILSYHAKDEASIIETIEAFSKRVHMPLDYTEIHEICQQDINMYIVVKGQEYHFYGNRKLVLAEDTENIKIVGRRSSPIVNEAVARHILCGTDIATTIKNCTDVGGFGKRITLDKRSAAGHVWIVDGKQYLLPEEFAIYASILKKSGIVYVKSYSNSLAQVSCTSANSIVDTKNNMQLALLDFDWYISDANQFLAEWLRKDQKWTKK